MIERLILPRVLATFTASDDHDTVRLQVLTQLREAEELVYCQVNYRKLSELVTSLGETIRNSEK